MGVKENVIQQRIRMALGSLPTVLVQRRNVGTFYTRDGRPQRIGTPGEADLQGIIDGQVCVRCGHKVHPLPYALEVKTAVGRQSKVQKNWQQNVWERRGGLYAIVRSVEEALKAVGL